MKRLVQLLAVCFACAAQGQGTFEAINTYTTTTSGTFPGTSGWIFAPTTNVILNALGVFRNVVDSQEGGPIYVGLWTSSGTLLASNAVTSSDTLVNQTRYIAVDPIELSPDRQYHLGAFSPGGPLFLDVYGLVETDTISMSPVITLIGAANSEGPFGFPAVYPDGQGVAFLAPNFTFAAIPEPSTLALLCLAGLAFAARRRFF